jgi:hypothetical protein
MSTILNSVSRSASRRDAQTASVGGSEKLAVSRTGVRSLSVLLLAAAVSALVIFADQYVSVWTDGHLFFGWVMLWAVIFAGLALFADTARNLAARAVGMLDHWSRSMAHARAEARLWEIAKSDPRVMSELMVARMRDQDTAQRSDFDDALAPMGFESTVADDATTGWGRFPERLAASRSHRIHLYYI